MGAEFLFVGRLDRKVADLPFRVAVTLESAFLNS